VSRKHSEASTVGLVFKNLSLTALFSTSVTYKKVKLHLINFSLQLPEQSYQQNTILGQKLQEIFWAQIFLYKLAPISQNIDPYTKIRRKFCIF
jgi:hypothetical protein